MYKLLKYYIKIIQHKNIYILQIIMLTTHDWFPERQFSYYVMRIILNIMLISYSNVHAIYTYFHMRRIWEQFSM